MPEQSGYKLPYERDDSVSTSIPTPSPAQDTTPSSVESAPSSGGYQLPYERPSTGYQLPYARSQTEPLTPPSTSFSEQPSSGGYQLPYARTSPSTSYTSSQSEPASSKPTEDPNTSWLKKSWNWVNHPLFDEDTAKNWFGADVEHWAGWKKGLFDIATGLTSPLSIAFAVGTLGTGSLLESGGVAALRATGMAAEDLGAVFKGTQAFSKAMRIGHDAEAATGIAEKAIADLGRDPGLFKSSMDTLSQAGLKYDSIINTGIARTTGTMLLRKAGVSASNAEKVTQWVATGAGAGFSAQNLYSAAITSPKVFDAIKEGDNETATRLAIDAVGQLTFGLLGSSATKKQAGDLLSDAEAAAGLRVKPSDENIKIRKILEESDGKAASISMQTAAHLKDWQKSYKDTDAQIMNIDHPESSKFSVKKDSNWIAGGVSESDLRARFSRESIPQHDERMQVVNQLNYNEANLTPERQAAVADASMTLRNPLSYWHDAVAEAAGRPEDRLYKGDFENIWFGTKEKEWIQNAIDEGTLKAKPKQYIDQLLAATDVSKWNSRELAYENEIGEYFNETNRDAIADGTLKKLNDRYVSRRFKDPDNPVVRKAKADLHSNYSNFEPQAIQKRIFGDLTLEALLRGYELTDDSMMETAANNRNSLTQLAAKRESLAALRAKGARTSDGKPLVALDLHGEVVESKGTGGEILNPAEIFQQSGYQSVPIAEKVIQGFKNNVIKPGGKPLLENEEWIKHNQLLDENERAAKAIQHSGMVDVDLRNNTGNERMPDINGKPLFQVEHPDYPGMTMARTADELTDPHAVHNAMAEKLKQFEKDVPKKAPTDPVGLATFEAAGNTVKVKIGDTPVGEGVLKSRPDLGKGTVQLGGTAIDDVQQGRGLGVKLHIEAAKYAQEQGQIRMFSDSKMSEQEENVWKTLQKRYPSAIKRMDDPRDAYDNIYTKPYVIDLKRFNDLVTGGGDKPFTELDKLIRNGDIKQIGTTKQGESSYVWTGAGYKTVGLDSFSDHLFLTKMKDVNGNETPVYIKGDIRVHPETYEYMLRRFGREESGFDKIPGGQAALTINRNLKGIELTWSPFHIMQEGLRALMSWVSPIGTERFNPDNPMHVLAAEKGVLEWNVKDMRKGIHAYQEGLTGHSEWMDRAASKVPGIRQVNETNNKVQHWLFNQYIPGLKLRAFERMYKVNEFLHKDWTEDKLGNETADEVNERFGGIPYKRLGRSASMQDLSRLALLAPDWLESELRFTKRLTSAPTLWGKDEGVLARQQFLGASLALYVAARVLNYTITGKPHNEAPFGVATVDSQGREKVYGIRTMPGDVAHMASDPLGFINGRFSPLSKIGTQMVTGRDDYGRKTDSNNFILNVLDKALPIGIDPTIKQLSGRSSAGQTQTDAFFKMGGGQVRDYRTEAQKLASEIASERSEGMPIDKDKLRRHQALLDMEDKLRAKQITPEDIAQAEQNGQLAPGEVKQMFKSVGSIPENLDPQQARLYSHAQKAAMPDLIRIFEAGTREERAMLAPLLSKKQSQYMKSAFKNMTPVERANDPTVQWIRRKFGAADIY